MDIRVRIMRLDLALEIPAYAHSGDSGLDLRSALSVELEPGGFARVPCGFAFEIPRGFEGQVRPRSGCAQERLVAIQATIDSSYRGEVGIQIENRGKRPVQVKRGDRIAQLIFAPVALATLDVVSELTSSTRGARGYGSTGRT